MFKYLRQLASESLVYGLSGVILRFLTILLVPIYTRIFTPEDYGVMSLIGSTVGVVAIFVVLALDNSAHRWFWDTEDLEDRKTTLASWAWCQVTVALGFAAIMYVAADYLGGAIVGREDAGVYFRLTALALPAGVLGGVLANWLRMQRRPWTTMLFALGTSLLSILLTIYFVVLLRWGLRGIYIAQFSSAVAGSVVAVILMRDWLHPAWFRFARLREMIWYALPLIPGALAFWVVNSCGRYFVQAYANTSEVGLYAVGSALAAGVALLTNAFQQAWGPFAFSIHKTDDARQVYAMVLLVYVWGTCLISCALALFAREILLVLTTPRYLAAAPVVGILAFGYVVIGLGYIASLGPSLAKKTGPTGLAITVAAVLNLVLSFLLVPSLGKQGSALATLASQAVVPVYLFYRSQQLYPIPYRFGPVVSMFAFSLTVVAAGSYLETQNLWIAIPLKASLLLSFIPVLVVFRVVTVSQLGHILRRAWYMFRRSVPPEIAETTDSALGARN